MKVASIVGTRPNFIKLAPLSKEVRKCFDEIIIHTGQHYDYEMDRIFFEQLGIPEPDYHLGVGSGTHGYQTGEMLKRIENVLINEKPDLVIVYGDTNTTLAGALAAVKLNIPIAHVEAGLRCFKKEIPEEVNRILVDHISDLLFCPTETAVRNLYKEGIANGVYLTGDVMVDAINQNIEIAKHSNILQRLEIEPRKYYLATVHRPKNTDNYERLKEIVEAFIQIENLIFPCHPRTEKMLKKFGLWNKLVNKVKVIKPVSYFEMLALEMNAKKIITDSGGIQKEAYILKVPCITLRESTEWVETVEDGWNILVGANKERILDAVENFEPKGKNYSYKFGDGKACKRIAEILIRWFDIKDSHP
jgi:UDP-N-acetylglucosamine 2-epimerase (non-hydrolysing)